MVYGLAHARDQIIIYGPTVASNNSYDSTHDE